MKKLLVLMSMLAIAAITIAQVKPQEVKKDTTKVKTEVKKTEVKKDTTKVKEAKPYLPVKAAEAKKDTTKVKK